MEEFLPISPSSKALLERLSGDACTISLSGWQQTESLTRLQVVSWLCETSSSDKKTRFLLESLRAALLSDLADSMLSPEARTSLQKKQASAWGSTIQFVFLAIAGSIFSVSEGFDGISALLNLFSIIPSGVVFAVGGCFSILSVIAFYGLDLVEISKNLGVKLSKTTRLLDVFLEQAKQIERLKDEVERYEVETDEPSMMIALNQIAAMLLVRYHQLDEARDIYLHALEGDWYLNVAKKSISVTAGFLFFGSGLSAGQTLGLAVAGLFMTSVSMTFWPVLVISVLAGVAAFSLYWFVQRPLFENLVSRRFGLDKQCVDALANKEAVGLQKRALARLSVRLNVACSDLNRLEEGVDHGVQMALHRAHRGRGGAFFASQSQSVLDEWNGYPSLSNERGLI